MGRSFVSAIIVAAGSGKRMGAGKNKLLLNICGKSVLAYTLLEFQKNDMIDEIILVAADEDRDKFFAIAKNEGINKLKTITKGGAERQHSVYMGIKEASKTAEIIAIHDGARCLVTKEIICDVIKAAKEFGAAVTGVKVKDTLKQVENGIIRSTLLREHIWTVQTPQAFKRDIILNAHQSAESDGFLGTDDCMLVERQGVNIKVVEGSYENIKITTKEDLFVGECILSR